MEGMITFYKSKKPAWTAGPHFYRANDGLWVMTPPTIQGIHANAANAFSLGYEVVGNYDNAPHPEPLASLVRQDVAIILKWMRATSSTIEGHRKYNKLKTCPGRAIDIPQFRKEVDVYMTVPQVKLIDITLHARTPVYEKPETGAPIALHGTAYLDPGVYQIDVDYRNGWVHLASGLGFIQYKLAPLFSTPSKTEQEMLTMLVKRNGLRNGYTAYDMKTIVKEYYRICMEVGLDAALLVAQMMHETGSLTSWWSARPRRNPAGIGVTGEIKPYNPSVLYGPDWQRDGSVIRKGYAFTSWNVAIQAHIGHLLTYAKLPANLTEEQRKRITTLQQASPRAFAIPPAWRNTAVYITDLNQRWAVGNQYGESILKVIT